MVELELGIATVSLLAGLILTVIGGAAWFFSLKDPPKDRKLYRFPPSWLIVGCLLLAIGLAGLLSISSIILGGN